MLWRVPRVGEQDAFEQFYLNKLRARLTHYGQLIGYEHDRATLDLGLHLYERPVEVKSQDVV